MLATHGRLTAELLQPCERRCDVEISRVDEGQAPLMIPWQKEFSGELLASSEGFLHSCDRRRRVARMLQEV